MNTLTVTITNPRTIDGLIFAANSAKLSPEDYATWLLTQDGKRYADANNYGVITSAAFFARFAPEEYSGVLAAAANTTEVPEPIGNVPTEEEQDAYDAAVEAFMAIPEPTEEDIATYQAAVEAYNATQIPDNQAEIDAAKAQNAEAAEIQALLNELTGALLVALDDQRVTDGLALLVSRGLLGADRPAVIVAYDRPFPDPAIDGGV
jgi:hypothetical protein